ncbi:MAG TPA: RsmE family RNA methyltransferase [Candidatus Dormibacteraeota bacterium]|nr:RsmE family RNA methyltransferase [Candidatus Dormibacteraeota bacterium]
MPHFYASERHGDRVLISGTDARHLAGPLRARVGESIAVVDPGGWLLTVRLDSVSAREIVGSVVASRLHQPEPGLAVTMALAMLPASALEESLSRCTELGARRFLLVGAARSVSRAQRPERWATICREAAMLAGRLRVPAVEGPVPFPRLLEEPSLLLLDARGGAPLAAGGLGPEVVLAVGPEGGWTPEELAAAGGRVRTLGGLNLRAENAGAAALATALAVTPDR